MVDTYPNQALRPSPVAAAYGLAALETGAHYTARILTQDDALAFRAIRLERLTE